MASEAEVPELNSLFERLLRYRDLSLVLPFILGFTTIQRENTNTSTSLDRTAQNPDQETQETSSTPTAPNERILLINPFTQGMVVIEGRDSLESLLGDLTSNESGQPPASKASIEALPIVEIGETEDKYGECVICLEEWEKDGEKVVKEMPCKHRFHANCIEKWLKIHGSCPVCRYKMPIDEDEIGDKRDDGQSERQISEREIWVTFSFSGNRRSETATENSNGNSSSSPSSDHEMET